MTPLDKTLSYYLVCKEKQLCCEKYSYRVFINAKGNDHIMKHVRLGPAQDVPYALILWYAPKTIYLS